MLLAITSNCSGVNNPTNSGLTFEISTLLKSTSCATKNWLKNRLSNNNPVFHSENTIIMCTVEGLKHLMK